MIKFLKSLLAAAALMCAVTGPVSALTTQTTPIGALTSNYASGASGIAPGLFLDYWTFTLPTDSYVSGTASVLSTLPATVISEFSAQFLNSSATPFFTFLPAGPTTLTAPLMQLSAGAYSLLVAGVAGSGGPAFSVNLSVTPVPEPGVALMLLAGVGLIGAVVRRKKR